MFETILHSPDRVMVENGRVCAEIIVDFYRTVLEAVQRHGILVHGCNAIGHQDAGLMLSANAMPREAARPLDWLETTLPRVWQIDGESVTFNRHGRRGQRLSFDNDPTTEE